VILNFLKKTYFIFIRKLERYPYFILLILNNINNFSFFLPHEKDYYGIKLIFNRRNADGCFIDVGGNTGTSFLGFRKLGFDNKIYLFEPNYFLFKKYLKKLKKKYQDIKIYNLALGSTNKKIFFYIPFIGKTMIHYFSGFNKNYVKKSCLNTFSDKKIFFKKKLLKIKKFDDLKIKDNVSFVKIDAEGYDLEVIKGMKKTIAKYHPVFLVEYNPQLQKKIIKLLKNYHQYYYNIQNDSIVKIKKLYKKNYDRFGHSNSLSTRNIFFIHQDKLKSI
jgi:FkbM family methyltransferase